MSRHEDAKGGSLCPLYAFGMIVGTFCTFFRLSEHFFLCVKSPSNRTNTHGGAITTAIIWTKVILTIGTDYP